MTTPHPFKPRRWLRNGHLQTIAGNFLPRVSSLPAATTELIPVPLPAEMRAVPEMVALNAKLPSRVLCHCHWQPRSADAPAVVLVHGLEGSSHSQYIAGNANKLYALGCSVIRMNMRNCGGTDALSPTLYHSGMSGDVIAVAEWLIARGCTRVALAGYSMGGNLVLKALGELGREAPPGLIAGIAVSPPMDLGDSADALHHWSNRLYERRFLRNLLARYRRKVKLYPAIFDACRANHVQSIRDFDEHVMTPYCGFEGASDYYARSGSARGLERIAIPVLVLHAVDDPFIRLSDTTRAKLLANPHISFLEPAHGGHCAFLEDSSEGYDGYWAERALLLFVRQHAEVRTGVPA